MAEFEDLLDKAASDKAWAARVRTDPAQALRDIGISNPTAEQVHALTIVATSVNTLGEHMEQEIDPLCG